MHPVFRGMMPRVALLALAATALGATAANPSSAARSHRTVTGYANGRVSVVDTVALGAQAAAPQHIRLRTRTFDPMTLDAERTRPDRPLRAGNSGAYIVQFTTAPLESHRKSLRELGVRIGAYIPDGAYVVRMNDKTRQQVEKLSFVRWVGQYDPGDKLDRTAIPAGTHRYVVTLVERDTKDQADVVKQIRHLGGTVEITSASGRLIEATLSADQALAVAHLEAVLALDLWSEPQSDMDIVRIAGGADAIETAQGYSGHGVRGEVMDTGVRLTHQEFTTNPPILHTSNTTNTSHGTSTYGQIFASGVNAAARGLLPNGQGIFAAQTLVTDRWAHTAQLVDPAGTYRAVFQSNSWGSTLTSNYNSISAALDDIVFDHDILICQSMGNTGNRTARPQAWAKNVVSVGGQFHYNTLSRTDDAWNGGSAIGAAADGRIKPDLSNYYDSVYTTTNTNNTAYTTGFSGTSAATPITCGYAGLMFQMWADGVFEGGPGLDRDVFSSRPHASTAKALLINTADQYAFTGETHDLTRTHQGWGTISAGNLYNEAQAHNWTLPILDNEATVLQQGQTATYTFDSDGTKPLKATMVYTDPMGSPTAAQARVNDLTLKVTAPDGTTVYWGNNGLKAGNWSTSGGSANTIDTVENVFIETPTAGTWTIEVVASQVNADGHVETGDTDADYALVVTG